MPSYRAQQGLRFFRLPLCQLSWQTFHTPSSSMSANGLIGSAGFDLARWLRGSRPTGGQTVAQRATDPFVEQHEEEGDADALGGEPIGVPTAAASAAIRLPRGARFRVQISFG